MGDAAEGDDAVDVDPFGDAALHESDIGGERTIDEPLKILP